MPDVFEQLLSAKWRDVEFPVTRMRASLAHDLVEHKYWGVDGARVEDTGLTPWRFTFSVPLISGLTPGKGERWKKNDLYPTQMRKLAKAFQLRTSGSLQHPEFGIILCKAEKFDLEWESNRRGGADGEISFVETMLPAGSLEKGFSDSPIQVAAETLDKESVKVDLEAIFKARGIPLPAHLQTSAFSFTDAMQKIQSIVDYPSLMEKRLSGQIDAMVYHAENLQKSVEKARTPMTWQITKSVELIKSVARNLNKQVTAQRRAIGLFTVPNDTTLAGVVRLIPEASAGDLIRLNPSLVQLPVIVQGTIVRYYLQQAA